LGENAERKWLTDVSQILMLSGRDMELSYAKEIVSISSAVSAQCTNVTDRQTDRHTDHGTVTMMPIDEIAFSDVA